MAKSGHPSSGLDAGIFPASALDHNKQPLCPRRLWPHLVQYDKPVFSGKLPDQAGGGEEFSKGVFRWRTTGKYIFLTSQSASSHTRGRCFWSYLRPGWSASYNGSKTTSICFPCTGPHSTLDGNYNSAADFLPSQHSLASPPGWACSGPDSRLLL